MKPEVVFPASLDELVEILHVYGDEAKVLAGGTAVVLMLQHGLLAPALLVGLQRVATLRFVEEQDEHVALGPLVSLQELSRMPLIRQHFPALADACGHVGNVRIRYQATIGGNLAEADYASDPPTALAVLGATISAHSAGGTRTIPVEDFFRGFYTTALEPDEVITAIHLPKVPSSVRMVYRRFTSRSVKDRPCANVAVWLERDGDVCRELRVAVGAACEVPMRFPDVEALATGVPLTSELINEIAHQYAARIDPLEDVRGSAWYRRRLVQVLVRRALEEVWR